MKLTDYIKQLIRTYFIIFSLIVILITVLRQFFSPVKYIETKDVFIYMICTLVSELPGLILYSPEEIPEKEMHIKMIIHFAALEAVLLILTNVAGWVKGIVPTVIFAVQIAVIYALVRLILWFDDKKTAGKINERLKTMKKETEHGQEE